MAREALTGRAFPEGGFTYIFNFSHFSKLVTKGDLSGVNNQFQLKNVNNQNYNYCVLSTSFVSFLKSLKVSVDRLSGDNPFKRIACLVLVDVSFYYI